MGATMDEKRGIDLSEFEVSARSDLPSVHIRFWQWLRLMKDQSVSLDEALNFLHQKDGVTIEPSKVITYLRDKDLIDFDAKDLTLSAKPWQVIPSRKRKQKEPNGTKPAEVAKPDKPAKLSSKLAKLSGREQAKLAFEKPKLTGAQTVIKDALDRTFRRVNDHRRSNSIPPLKVSDLRKRKRQWREFTKTYLEHNASLTEFLDFAFEQSKWLKDVVYPPINILAGPWIWEKWEMRDPAEKILRVRHAGKSYAPPPEDLQKRLVDAGFEYAKDLDDAQLRFIESDARTRHEAPHLANAIETEWEDAIAWLTNWIKEHDDDGDS